MDKNQVFIEKAVRVHGKKYKYDKVNYINNCTKVVIICPVHGEFLQSPCKHTTGQGCRKCAFVNQANRQSSTKETFIKIARDIHGEKYNYDKVNYVNARTG